MKKLPNFKKFMKEFDIASIPEEELTPVMKESIRIQKEKDKALAEAKKVMASMKKDLDALQEKMGVKEKMTPEKAIQLVEEVKRSPKTPREILEQIAFLEQGIVKRQKFCEKRINQSLSSHKINMEGKTTI